MTTNPTHDPSLTSWVASANNPECHFPIQNLPYGVFSVGEQPARIGVAIGDQILDLAALENAGVLTVSAATTPVFLQSQLNPFMALPKEQWAKTRADISSLLSAGNGVLRDSDLAARALVPLADATMHLPFFVRSFTDFYASREHATNVGTMFRGADNALMPNWLHIPIGYNGRASTVVVSDTDVRRPLGQLMPAGAEAPIFGACKRLDIELEIGAVVGTPNGIGQPVTVERAYEMIFGYVVLNDWSARDIQKWEYQPLGPFQGKAFATTISPWVVTREALEPYRVNTPERVKPLLPYLQEQTPNNYNLELEIGIRPKGADGFKTISKTNYSAMYYSSAQQLAHHASSGCAMETGDLLGSGTISGTTQDSYGSMLELSWAGKNQIDVGGGMTRTFLEDGDTVVMTGWCQGDGHRIGFGDCRGTITPACEKLNG